MYQTGRELEEVFITEGVFYKLEVDGRKHICRSRSVIRRKDADTEKADALFVLLNPGKSLPVGGEDEIQLLNGEVRNLPILPAIPDNTLYQLMRLMERRSWDLVWVVNLTDLRTGRFDEFKESQRFMNERSVKTHSIFSDERLPELAAYADKAETIIAGWGTKSSIRPTAEMAYSILTELGTVSGVAYKDHPLFYHPFPWIQGKCIEWLDKMEEQLKEVEQLT